MECRHDQKIDYVIILATPSTIHLLFSCVMELATCFKLGRALRYGDAEAFFHVYDGLEKECAAATQDQVRGQLLSMRVVSNVTVS